MKSTHVSRAARTAAELLVAALLVSGCEDQPGGRATGDSPTHRMDLGLQTFRVPVSGGQTPRLEVELPPNASSMLIEVRADGGFFFIDEFITPTGQELARSGQFITREAREVSGLADFLFPNDDTFAPVPGLYQLSFTAAADRAGTLPYSGGEAVVRVYTVQRDLDDTCGISLDFLVDYDAIDQASFQDSLGQLVARTDQAFRQVGIAVVDAQVQQIDLQSPDINVGDDTVLAVADDVLEQARRQGSARTDSLRVILVRSIAGENAPGFNPAGYSMGLPGPYDADRPNAAVLVATDTYSITGPDGTVSLDVEGMATSLTHELGHFLGLYHTSEVDGATHDPLAETPECNVPSACSDAFRSNLMTSASWLNNAGLDPTIRTTFTSGQGRVMRRHPLCVPYDVMVTDPTCALDCAAPEICALLSDGAGGQYQACLPACDPRSDVPCDFGTCLEDRVGTNVCQ